MSNSLTKQIPGRYNKLRLGRVIYNLDKVQVDKSGDFFTCKARYLMLGQSRNAAVQSELVFQTSKCLSVQEAAGELVQAVDEFLAATKEQIEEDKYEKS